MFNDATVTEYPNKTTEEVMGMMAKNSKHMQPCILLYGMGEEVEIPSKYVSLKPGHIS